MKRIMVVAACWVAVEGVVLAQAGGNPQADAALRSAQVFEWLGYILAAAGILLVAASIPVAMYLDKRKKARKEAAKRGTKPEREGKR